VRFHPGFLTCRIPGPIYKSLSAIMVSGPGTVGACALINNPPVLPRNHHTCKACLQEIVPGKIHLMIVPRPHGGKLHRRCMQKTADAGLLVRDTVTVGLGPTAGQRTGSLSQMLTGIPNVVVRMAIENAGEPRRCTLASPALSVILDRAIIDKLHARTV